MSVFKFSSLERYITISLWMAGLPFPMLFALWAISLNTNGWIVLAGVVLIVISLALAVGRFRTVVMSTFSRATMHLDAINQQDYNQWSKPLFEQGKVAELHQQLVSLSCSLQEKKTRYDHHVFLIYQLIEQLQTPILVFNARNQLSFGNEAFNYLFQRPWQMCRNVSPTFLGLKQHDGHWQFDDPQRNQQWEIRHSEFIETGQSYHLLVFINIESALLESQLNAWQQIIRVLSHEIRNSLAPVSSLAETLINKVQGPREKKALEVITGRCQYLQDFVSRYASLSKKLDLSCQWIASGVLVQRIEEFFKPFNICSDVEIERIWGDATFLEQVIINLVKNAVEANAKTVLLSVKGSEHQGVVRICDDGDGFANLENLFVPLYTTKPQGQGIGLNFCRNIISQHNGSFELKNNCSIGVTVTLKLPNPV